MNKESITGLINSASRALKRLCAPDCYHCRQSVEYKTKTLLQQGQFGYLEKINDNQIPPYLNTGSFQEFDLGSGSIRYELIGRNNIIRPTMSGLGVRSPNTYFENVTWCGTCLDENSSLERDWRYKIGVFDVKEVIQNK